MIARAQLDILHQWIRLISNMSILLGLANCVIGIFIFPRLISGGIVVFIGIKLIRLKKLIERMVNQETLEPVHIEEFITQLISNLKVTGIILALTVILGFLALVPIIPAIGLHFSR